MERLTKRHGKHAVQIGGETRRHDVGWLRLAELEDMMEQGKLVEQKRGQWEYNQYSQMYCTNCGLYPEFAIEWNYCPNCGADMRVAKILENLKKQGVAVEAPSIESGLLLNLKGQWCFKEVNL